MRTPILSFKFLFLLLFTVCLFFLGRSFFKENTTFFDLSQEIISDSSTVSEFSQESENEVAYEKIVQRKRKDPLGNQKDRSPSQKANQEVGQEVSQEAGQEVSSENEKKRLEEKSPPFSGLSLPRPSSLPHIDRIGGLFSVKKCPFPIVETISYSTSVPWLEGKPAWIADYASHYHTSRHFIARSLNGKPDYESQGISIGKKFNVFRKDRPIEFYLVVSKNSCSSAFYYYDVKTEERVLLKTYPVALGQLDEEAGNTTRIATSSTPSGTYRLGERVAIYKPTTMGYFHDQKVEMVRAFGTRWIPFTLSDQSLVKGVGLSGLPWVEDPSSGGLIENKNLISTYTTHGSVAFLAEDIEEIFSIVITHPSFVVIVENFEDAQLPGHLVQYP